MSDVGGLSSSSSSSSSIVELVDRVLAERAAQDAAEAEEGLMASLSFSEQGVTGYPSFATSAADDAPAHPRDGAGSSPFRATVLFPNARRQWLQAELVSGAPRSPEKPAAGQGQTPMILLPTLMQVSDFMALPPMDEPLRLPEPALFDGVARARELNDNAVRDLIKLPQPTLFGSLARARELDDNAVRDLVRLPESSLFDGAARMADDRLSEGERASKLEKIVATGSHKSTLSATAIEYLCRWVADNDTLYPTFEEYKEIAKEVSVSHQRVRKWFSNQRQKTVKAANGPAKPVRISAEIAQEIYNWIDRHGLDALPNRQTVADLAARAQVTKRHISLKFAHTRETVRQRIARKNQRVSGRKVVDADGNEL